MGGAPSLPRSYSSLPTFMNLETIAPRGPGIVTIYIPLVQAGSRAALFCLEDDCCSERTPGEPSCDIRTYIKHVSGDRRIGVY